MKVAPASVSVWTPQGHCAPVLLRGGAFWGSFRRMTTQTIEATSKKWKSYLLAGVLLTLAGLPVWVALVAKGHSGVPGILIGSVGVAMYVYARFGSWWNHG